MLVFRLTILVLLFVIFFVIVNTNWFQKLWAKFFSSSENATTIEDDLEAARAKREAAKVNLEKRKKILESERNKLDGLDSK